MSSFDLCALLLETLRAKQPPDVSTELAFDDVCGSVHTELLELRRFIMALAAGDLSTPLTLKGYTAGALKSLHANLKHMTWQTQMIASGDFSQRLDFLGDFSLAFNSMTEQLETSVRIIKEKEDELLRINAGLEQEIAERIKAQAALAQSEAHYRNLTETMKDVVWILNAETLYFSYVSPSVYALRGYTPEEVCAQPLDLAVTATEIDRLKAMIARQRDNFSLGLIGPDMYFTTEVEQPCKDGSTVWTEVIARVVRNDRSGVTEVHGVTRDISDRRALRLELERQATTDALTEVANRRHFLSQAHNEMARCQRHEYPLSLLMLDIDHFKRVNDTFGHAVGDTALHAVATACRKALRTTDVVGRIGGEEFALLLVESSLEHACGVAERLRAQVAALALYADQGQAVPLTVSIGVAQYRTTGEESLADLMARADRALYQAKTAGRNRVEKG